MLDVRHRFLRDDDVYYYIGENEGLKLEQGVTVTILDLDDGDTGGDTVSSVTDGLNHLGEVEVPEVLTGSVGARLIRLHVGGEKERRGGFIKNTARRHTRGG